MKKKIITMLVLTCVSTSILAGCGKEPSLAEITSDTSTEETSEEEITETFDLSLLDPDEGYDVTDYDLDIIRNAFPKENSKVSYTMNGFVTTISTKDGRFQYDLNLTEEGEANKGKFDYSLVIDGSDTYSYVAGDEGKVELYHSVLSDEEVESISEISAFSADLDSVKSHQLIGKTEIDGVTYDRVKVVTESTVTTTDEDGKETEVTNELAQLFYINPETKLCNYVDTLTVNGVYGSNFLLRFHVTEADDIVLRTEFTSAAESVQELESADFASQLYSVMVLPYTVDSTVSDDAAVSETTDESQGDSANE